VTGGTLAPGSAASPTGTLTINGSLSFTAASTYLVQVSSTNASLTNVLGAATLGNATVSANFISGTVQKQYKILSATGGLGGTTFNSAVVSNMPTINATLSYDASNNVFLNIGVNFTPSGGGLSVNQQNVANTLTNFFNSTGGIAAAFAALTPAGLTTASGELGTGIIQSAINADGQFLSLMLDPTVVGRSSGFTKAGSVAQFADSDEAAAYASMRPATAREREAYAMATKAPLLSSQPINRWSVWAAGYGGSAQVGGNTAVGSQDLTARVWGGAAGADYRISLDTLVGFSLGGGGLNYSLANAMGAGSADLFQAGVYGRHNFGPAYIAAALAYGWHDVTTNRTVALAGADQLQGRFKADTFSARFEGGYRFTTPLIGITPYAAAQVTNVNLPNYSEVSLNGGGLFALNYGAVANRHPLRARPAHRQILRDAERRADPARPRRLGTRLQSEPRRHRAVPDPAGHQLRRERRQGRCRLRAGQRQRRDEMAERLLDRRHLRRRILRQRHQLFRQGRVQIQLVSCRHRPPYFPACHWPETPKITLTRPVLASFSAVACGTWTSSWSTNRNGMPASRS
jgi:hypothetical protein